MHWPNGIYLSFTWDLRLAYIRKFNTNRLQVAPVLKSWKSQIVSFSWSGWSKPCFILQAFLPLFRCQKEADLSLRYQGNQGVVLRLKGELFIQSLLMMSSSVVTHHHHLFSPLFILCSHWGCIFCSLMCCRGSAGTHCAQNGTDWEFRTGNGKQQVSQVPEVRKGVWVSMGAKWGLSCQNETEARIWDQE